MISGKQVSAMVQLVGQKLGEDDAREWWKTSNPDLDGKSPGELMHAGILGNLTLTQEDVLRAALITIPFMIPQ